MVLAQRLCLLSWSKQNALIGFSRGLKTPDVGRQNSLERPILTT